MRSIEEALGFYVHGLGLKVSHEEVVEEQKTRVMMLPLGESRIELLEATEPDSPIGRFIANRGEGIHHICFQVDNVTRELEILKEEGYRLIDANPRWGADNCKVAFVHPKASGGVLIELSEHPEPGPTTDGKT